MNFKDLRVGWRTIVQEPGFSAVAVLGLAVGLATCFLLFRYVAFSFSYDSQVPHGERVYVLKHRMNLLKKPTFVESMPLPFQRAADRSGAVELASVVVPLEGNLGVDGRTQRMSLQAVDPAFVDLFGVGILEGDAAQALSRPDGLALSEEAAGQLFGTAAAIGKTALIDGKAFTVKAILKNPPANTTVPYAALVGVSSTAWPAADRRMAFEAWGHLGGRIYVRLRDGHSAEQLAEQLQHASDRSPFLSQLPANVLQELGQKKVMDIRVAALRDAYFDAEPTEAGIPRGNKTAVVAVASIAVMVLALAVTNYVNLAAVRTVRRQREIAMRKVLGASPAQIVFLFVMESVGVALLACLVGLLAANAFLPYFSELINRQLPSLLEPGAALAALGISCAIGAAAGAYPAWVALRVPANRALAGRGDQEIAEGAWLRRVLTVLQFACAIGLSSVALAVTWQTRFVSSHDPGFQPERYVTVDLPEELSAPRAAAFRDSLVHIPGVRGVAASMDPIGRAGKMIGWETQYGRADGSKVTVDVQDVSRNYFAVYNVAPRAGRFFDEVRDSEDTSNNVVVNASAALQLGFSSAADAVGKTIQGGEGRPQTIIGIAPDMGRQTLREVVTPLIYKPGRQTDVLVVQAQGDIASVQNSIEREWQRHFPNTAPQTSTESVLFLQRYADDLSIARLLVGATVITACIAAFGIYVLAAYSVQRRSKQIVLHRLYGAPPQAIARLVGTEFFVLVGIAALLAAPLAWLAIEQYLANFVIHAPNGGLTLLLSVAAAVIIAALATGRHVWEAVRLAPARLLRA